MEKGYVELTPTDLPLTLSIDQLYSIYSYYYTPQFSFRGECHKPWEIVYVQSGRVIVSTPEYSCPLEQGMMLLHKPLDFHRIRADNISCYVNVISFTVFECETLLPLADKPILLDKTELGYLVNIISDGTSIIAGKNHVPAMKKWETKKFAAHQSSKTFWNCCFCASCASRRTRRSPKREARRAR